MVDPDYPLGDLLASAKLYPKPEHQRVTVFDNNRHIESQQRKLNRDMLEAEQRRKGVWPIGTGGIWEARRIPGRPHMLSVHRTDDMPVPFELEGEWTSLNTITAKLKSLGLISQDC